MALDEGGAPELLQARAGGGEGLAGAFGPGTGVLRAKGTGSQRASGAPLQSRPFCRLRSHTGTHTSRGQAPGDASQGAPAARAGAREERRGGDGRGSGANTELLRTLTITKE